MKRSVPIALVLLAGLAAACGSSSTGASSTTAKSSSSSQAASSSPTGTPIKIGLADPTSGPAPYPEAGYGAQAAVHYVNTDLGGINGHPLQLVTCNTDGTPETNVNCANTFVQDGVVAVVDGYEAAAGAELPILHSAKIPMVGQIAKDATTDHDPQSYMFGPPDAAFAIGPLQLMKNDGLKNAAFAALDIPSFHAYFNGYILPAAKALGLNVSVDYYSATNTNWTVVAATLASKSPQIAGVVAAAQSDCTSLLKALRSSGYSGKIILGACTNFATTDPSQAAGVWSYAGNWLPSMISHAPALVQQQIKTFESAMKATGNSGKANATDEQASGTFSAVVDLAKIMQGAKGTLTGAVLGQAIHNTSNFQSFLGPQITCNHTMWPGTSACSNKVLVISATSNGTFAPATTANGGYTLPNTSIIH